MVLQRGRRVEIHALEDALGNAHSVGRASVSQRLQLRMQEALYVVVFAGRAIVGGCHFGNVIVRHGVVAGVLMLVLLMLCCSRYLISYSPFSELSGVGAYICKPIRANGKDSYVKGTRGPRGPGMILL